MIIKHQYITAKWAKARLRAESLLRILDFICIEIRTNYHNKNSALRRALKERLRGTGILK